MNRVPDSQAPTLSVAIPCFNAQNTLAQVLNSVLSQVPPETEVIIVNDGSTDNSLKVLSRYQVRTINHETRRGVAAARNTALAAAHGEIISYLDTDAVPGQGYFTRVMSHFHNPEVSGVGGQGIEIGGASVWDLWRRYFWVQTYGPYPRASVPMLPGLCSSYRIAALTAVGGFDESYRTNGEDVDLGVRLTEAGYTLVYDPNLRVHHLRTDNGRSLTKMIFRHAFWQTVASRRGSGLVPTLLFNSLLWPLIATYSSVVRHGNLPLAGISPYLCSVALVARLLGAVWPHRARRLSRLHHE